MLLCPWDFTDKNSGVGCHFLLQGIFLTQDSNLHFLCLLHCRWILYLLRHWGITSFWQAFFIFKKWEWFWNKNWINHINPWYRIMWSCYKWLTGIQRERHGVNRNIQRLRVWTSLVVQWLRIYLSVQGTWVGSLVKEDLTCFGTVKPSGHNHWAHMLQLLKTMLHNKRIPQWEAQARQWRVAPACHVQQQGLSATKNNDLVNFFSNFKYKQFTKTFFEIMSC